MTNQLPPKLPAVGDFLRSQGTLIEIQDVTDPPPKPDLDYIFEVVTAELVGYINGKLIQRFETFHEFSGPGTAVENAIAEAAVKRSVFGDALELRVIKHTSRIRRKAKAGTPCWYDKEFVDFITKPNSPFKGLPEIPDQTVWSSLKPDERTI